ncbi:hypothetical protein ATY78_19835 [Rhizobium sp. R635]|nr:hypothetical protein ATY78_19835 [Rhizobium sp. R635]
MGRLKTNHQHFDAQRAAMSLGQLARIFQSARGNDDLLDQLGANASAPVQNPLDRRGAHTGKTRDVPIIRLAHTRFHSRRLRCLTLPRIDDNDTGAVEISHISRTTVRL